MAKTTPEWTSKDISKSLYHGDEASFPIKDYKYVGPLDVDGSDDDTIQPTIFLDLDLSDGQAHVVEFYAPWVSSEHTLPYLVQDTWVFRLVIKTLTLYTHRF
jgi:hypothetical protein